MPVDAAGHDWDDRGEQGEERRAQRDRHGQPRHPADAAQVDRRERETSTMASSWTGTPGQVPLCSADAERSPSARTSESTPTNNRRPSGSRAPGCTAETPRRRWPRCHPPAWATSTPARPPGQREPAQHRPRQAAESPRCPDSSRARRSGTSSGCSAHRQRRRPEPRDRAGMRQRFPVIRCDTRNQAVPEHRLDIGSSARQLEQPVLDPCGPGALAGHVSMPREPWCLSAARGARGDAQAFRPRPPRVVARSEGDPRR